MRKKPLFVVGYGIPRFMDWIPLLGLIILLWLVEDAMLISYGLLFLLVVFIFIKWKKKKILVYFDCCLIEEKKKKQLIEFREIVEIERDVRLNRRKKHYYHTVDFLDNQGHSIAHFKSPIDSTAMEILIERIVFLNRAGNESDVEYVGESSDEL